MRIAPPSPSTASKPLRSRLRLPLVVSLALHASLGGLVVGGAAKDAPPVTPEAQGGLSGDTFEVPEMAEPDALSVAAGGAPLNAAAPPQRPETDGANAGDVPAARSSEPTSARRKAAHDGARRAARGTARSGDEGGAGGSTTAAALYGAVGERGAIDLATAFTRAFPQATSGDPAWARAPMGSAGNAELTLELDATGHLVRAAVSGSPSPALRAGIERTLVLIRARSFVAAAKISRLGLTASITPDTVHDGLHGEVFALGNTFTGGSGTAFFALSIGRRIDLTVTRR